MPALTLHLASRPDVVLQLGDHEGIETHGVLQAGVITTDQTLPISDQVILIHEAYAPVYNLAVECSLPTWLTGFAVQLLPPLVPAVPGPSVSVFLPGLPWIIPHGLPLPVAPLDPFTATALAATNIPGGFSFFSQPGAVHAFRISGTILPGLLPGLYKHIVYVSGTLSPTGFPRQRIARFAIAVNVQRSDYP